MNVIAKSSCYFERSVVTLKLRKEYLNTVTYNIPMLLRIKYWTVWYIERYSMSTYTGVSNFQKTVRFFWPTLYLLLRPGRGAKYCDQFIYLCVCVCVCVSVCEHISGTAEPIFMIFARSPVVVARFSSGGVALRYVLPVLWITSRLFVVGRIAGVTRPGRSLMSMNASLCLKWNACGC